MTPTQEQIVEWRKEFELAWILDEGAYKSSTAKQFYEAGYIHARTEQATEIAELKAQRDLAISMLAAWCVAVDENGSGWDDWDEYYKDAMYRPSPLRELLDTHIANERELRKD